MKHLATISGALILGVALSTTALADHKRSTHNYTDYADVLKVKPIREMVKIDTPRQECWTEHVTYYRRHNGSYTPEILGGIIGAAVGNQFGSGSGRGVATAAGALLGGSIAHDYKRKHSRGHAYTKPVERCETHHEYHTEERIVGYKVKYRYNGRVYRTHMDQHPGDRIRVRVNVTPMD